MRGDAPRRAARVLLDAFFPGRCALCGEWLAPEGAAQPLCATCALTLRPAEGPTCQRCGVRLISEHEVCMRCRGAGFVFAQNTALLAYAGDARVVLNAFKFSGRLRLARFFADLAAAAIGTAGAIPIVPVPSRPRRRTPDPVGLVARALARERGFRVLRLLERTGGAQQKTLDLDQRRENLLGRIRLSRRADAGPVPEELILLDVVFTTGATLDACARVLVASGCRCVRGLTLVIEE